MLFAYDRTVGHVQPMSPSSRNPGLKIELIRPISASSNRVHLALASDSRGFTRRVVVKPLDTDVDVVAVRERARLLGGLAQSQLLRIEDSVRLDTGWAVVLEYVEGLNLERLLHTPPGLSPRSALQSLAGTTCALAAAWERIPLGVRNPLRLVHGSLTLDRLMLSKDGELKVLGFGPEQESISEEDNLTHKQDVYDLGLIAAQMLGGRIPAPLPDDPKEHDKLIERMVYGIEDVGMPNPDWEEALRDTLCQMTAYDADARPTAVDLQPIVLQFAEHASGESLASLAVRVVQPTVAQEETDAQSDVYEHADPFDDDLPTNPGDSQRFAEARATIAGAPASTPAPTDARPLPIQERPDELDASLPATPEPTDARPLPMRERRPDDVPPAPIEGDWAPEDSMPFERQATQWEPGPGAIGKVDTPPEAASSLLETVETPIEGNAWRQPTTALPSPDLYTLEEPRPLNEPAPEDEDTLPPSSTNAASDSPPLPQLAPPKQGAPTIARPTPSAPLHAAPTLARPTPRPSAPASIGAEALSQKNPKARNKALIIGLVAFGVLISAALFMRSSSFTLVSNLGENNTTTGSYNGTEGKADDLSPGPKRSADLLQAPAAESPPAATTQAGPGTTVRLTAEDGLVQWFRLTEEDSEIEHKGRGELVAKVPPGTYLLALKRIGQPILETKITVGEEDLEYRCAKNPDDVFECSAPDQVPVIFAIEE